MIKVVLFDVDGVLVQGEPFSYRLEQEYGISKDLFKPFFKNIFPACLTGKADLKQVLADHLHQWGWQQSADDFLHYWFVSEHNIDEPLVEYVQQLRKHRIPCYLATNQEHYRTALTSNRCYGKMSTFVLLLNLSAEVSWSRLLIICLVLARDSAWAIGASVGKPAV